MTRLSSRTLVTWLAVLLPVAFLCALIVGPEFILPFLDSSDSSPNQLIIEQIRMPRAIMAAIIGATLAVSGVMMQGLFRNPLADPSLIGVTSGASAGASFVIVIASSWLGLNEWLGVSLVAVGAFVGAVIATSIVYKLAASATGTSVATMLLAVIAFRARAGAINSFFSFIADNHMLRQISLWQMGSLNGASWSRVTFAVLVLGSLMFFFPRFSGALNALLLGESEARHLGIDVDAIKRRVTILVALAVGVSVSLTGTIAFVGLVTPHIIRLLIGPDHRFLIPCSAMAGAVLLMLADACSRYIIAPSELPIGVVTALLGAPFFLSLLRKHREIS